MYMDIYEIRKLNLVQLISSQRKSACAERWEMAPAHLSQLLSDKTAKNMGDDIARKIEVAERLPRGWMDWFHGVADLSRAVAARIPLARGDLSLISRNLGIDDSPVTIRLTEEEMLDPVNQQTYAFVTQYTAQAAAGQGNENPHVEIRGALAFKREWLRTKGVNPKNLDVIYADGESMWPTINDHDVLLIDRSRMEPVDGKVFALQSYTKGLIVKRLVLSELDGWIVRSDNPDKISHADLLLPDGEINELSIQGQVIWRGGDL